MPVTVRPRTADDMGQCAELLREVHRIDGYPVEGVADPIAWLSPADISRAWVGELDGVTVGHAVVSEPTETDAAAALWAERSGDPASRLLVFGRLFVGSAGRGQGVGGQLVLAAMTYAQDRERRLVLDVMDKDKAAIRLYERLGWMHIGSTTHRFGDGDETAAHCYVAPDMPCLS